MLLNPPDGCACDCCGVSCRHNFTYYSLDFCQVDAKQNRFITNEHNQIVFSLDACEKCMASIMEAIKTNYMPTTVGINCDLCESKMRGNFSFYKCDVTKITVSADKATKICKKCNKTSPTSPCACGSVEGAMILYQDKESSVLQLVACKTDYDRFVAGAVRIRALLSNTTK